MATEYRNNCSCQNTPDEASRWALTATFSGVQKTRLREMLNEAALLRAVDPSLDAAAAQ